MLKLWFIFFYLIVKICNGEHERGAIELNEDALVPTANSSGIDYTSEVDLEKVIATVERAVLLAKSYGDDVLPKVEVENLFEEMIETLDDVINLLNNPMYAYKFFKAKGENRIIVASINIPHSQLRTRLLTLLKILFDVASTTTNAVIPVNLIDKLIDIFENDDNLGIKSLVLDVLHKWLPGNPRIQARVMRIKGLEPFYHQIIKLDATVIRNLLDLFRKILIEHLDVRNNKVIRSEIDSDTLVLYQRIGLIEHLSTPTVCDGLLNIFQVTYSSKDNNILVPVFDLVVKTKPFCLKYYRGNVEAMELFATLLNYVKDKDKMEYIAQFDMNVTNIEEILTDYVEKLKSLVKDEF